MGRRPQFGIPGVQDSDGPGAARAPGALPCCTPRWRSGHLLVLGDTRTGGWAFGRDGWGRVQSRAAQSSQGLSPTPSDACGPARGPWRAGRLPRPAASLQMGRARLRCYTEGGPPGDSPCHDGVRGSGDDRGLRCAGCGPLPAPRAPCPPPSPARRRRPGHGRGRAHLLCEFLLLFTCPRPVQPGVGHLRTFSCMARTWQGEAERRAQRHNTDVVGHANRRAASTRSRRVYDQRPPTPAPGVAGKAHEAGREGASTAR